MTSADTEGPTGTPEARGLTALLTTAMAFSMMQLFLIGALGPRLVERLGVSETLLGLTTTVGFGTAAVLSPAGGRIVDRTGPRRALVALLAVSAVALGLIGAAPGPGLLLAAVALGGLPQALANPATNKAILAAVPAPRRGAVTGTKQSGVQLGAFAAGLPLAAAAGLVGWRGAVWLAAAAALLAAVWAWRALPPDAPRRMTASPAVRAGSAPEPAPIPAQPQASAPTTPSASTSLPASEPAPIPAQPQASAPTTPSAPTSLPAPVSAPISPSPSAPIPIPIPIPVAPSVSDAGSPPKAGPVPLADHPRQAVPAGPLSTPPAAPPVTPPAVPPAGSRPPSPAASGSPVPWLAAFSLFLGAGIASVNTYLALFGAQRLGMGPTMAGVLVAVLGVAGIGGRVGWARAATPGRAPWLPAGLAGGAVLAAVLLAAAVRVEPLVWPAAVAVGVFAVSGNAVSMVLVMQRSAPGRAGQDSALVAAGFFAGFAVGPPLFGLLAERARYGRGWLLVAVEFAVAGAVALAWVLRDRRTGTGAAA
ncbi:MFS transporter [Streptomyces sp. NPDC127114]|uniref:MFS transporter n=1 Tax=Streptomyces sp. NPDC127114 TaxID=3345366 RepID=UPI0036406EB1